MSSDTDSGKRFKTALTYTSNARANQKAWARMSELERSLGITAEEYERMHAEQKARVLKRYGLAT